MGYIYSNQLVCLCLHYANNSAWWTRKGVFVMPRVLFLIERTCLKQNKSYSNKPLEVIERVLHWYDDSYIPTQIPSGKIKLAICNHQADCPFYLWLGVWFGNLHSLKVSPTWHQMSLLRPDVIRQHKTRTCSNKMLKFWSSFRQSLQI